jgi:glycosyltransferase involved in cell wall biosynthesis
LLHRYVEWGIPREKIRYEEYGRRGLSRPEEAEEERPRNRLGFFGQLNPFKGLNVLLEAMRILGSQKPGGASPIEHGCGETGPRASGVAGGLVFGPSNVHLWIHGANLELQGQDFQKEFRLLLEATKQNVTSAGRYDRAELPRLMANIDWVVVPSTWWENSPLVIQEAFASGRPVICSDIGGMAEKVTDGVNGLHFRVADPVSLARTIHRAAGSPDLWQTLHDGIPKVHTMEDHVATLEELYVRLLDAAPGIADKPHAN